MNEVIKQSVTELIEERDELRLTVVQLRAEALAWRARYEELQASLSRDTAAQINPYVTQED